MLRSLTAPILLAAAVGVPYVASQGPNIDGLWNGKRDFSTQAPPSLTEPALVAQKPGNALYVTSTPLEGMHGVSMLEVFRFDITKEWVYQRWARKSTALAELGLYGVRVPLVTGTQLHDLAGSLTYYFSASGRLERITFSGRTGDTSQLVMLMSQSYGLVQQPTPVAGEHVLQYRRGELVISELRTQPAPVLWANAPHESFAVDLVLQRPDAVTPLPPRVSAPAPKPPTDPQKAASSTANKKPSAKQAADEEPALGWRAFLPRSRVPKEQIENLQRPDQFR